MILMTRLDTSEWHGCPTRYAAGIIGDRWSLVILRDVLLHGKRYYSDMLTSPEGISTNILADRLSKLEAAGLLERREDVVKKSKVLYLPTRKGRAFLPALLAMMVWSTEFDAQTEAPPSFATAWKDDPKKTITWYEDQIDQVNAAIGV